MKRLPSVMSGTSAVAALLAALLSSGCATTSQEGAERPVKHAERVKILMYDSESRRPTTHLDIYDSSRPADQTSQVIRAHKVIAKLMCEGAADEEPEMVNAINYRARRIGANGVVILPPDRTGSIWSAFGSRRMFRANAIVYTEGAKSE